MKCLQQGLIWTISHMVSIIDNYLLQFWESSFFLILLLLCHYVFKRYYDLGLIGSKEEKKFVWRDMAKKNRVGRSGFEFFFSFFFF